MAIRKGQAEALDKADENIRIKPSGWYYADLAVAVLTVLGLWFTMTPVMFWAFSRVLIIALIAGIIVYARKKYYADKLSKPWRIAAWVIRGTLYALALFSLSTPFIISADLPVLYPLQKAIYLKNYTNPESIFDFLPDNIPSNAENYRVRFVPKFLQGEANIQIEFFTDPPQLEEYRNYAKSRGAVKLNRNEGWEQAYINERTGREEAAEIWEFPAPTGGGYPASYCICPESGYFMIYW